MVQSQWVGVCCTILDVYGNTSGMCGCTDVMLGGMSCGGVLVALDGNVECVARM